MWVRMPRWMKLRQAKAVQVDGLRLSWRRSMSLDLVLHGGKKNHEEIDFYHRFSVFKINIFKLKLT